MSSISSISNSNSLYTQSTTQALGTQQTKVHHHHQQNGNMQDSIQISEQGDNSPLSTSSSSILDSLVASGTITSDQESAIESAFQSARQSSQYGVYGSKSVNPISNLISNGTITKEQATSIVSAFKSAAHAANVDATSSATRGMKTNSALQAAATSEQKGVHHHHRQHRPDAVQSTAQVDNSITSDDTTQAAATV